MDDATAHGMNDKEGPMKSERARQAEYAAKNRQKAKSIGRPDARAVADAYMAACEEGGLEQLMRIYIKKLAPDADADAGSQQVVEMVRSLVLIVLFERGFNNEQIKDKMRSMQND
jgi:hypothetical protein